MQLLPDAGIGVFSQPGQKGLGNNNAKDTKLGAAVRQHLAGNRNANFSTGSTEARPGAGAVAKIAEAVAA